MKTTIILSLLTLAAVSMATSVRTGQSASPSGGALAGERFRVIVSTDIGGSDPDDFQSMVHYLMYADLIDTEALISSPPHAGRKQHILEVLDAYAADYSKLRAQSARFPSPDALHAITKQGAVDAAPPAGFSTPTEGSRWLIERARADDPRPLWILVWGSITDVAQALHDAPDIKPKLRVYFISSWNRRMDQAARDYVVQQHPDLWLIEAETTFRGMYVGGNQASDLSNREFIARHVQGHGALGDLLAAKKADIKMGDTPSVLYLLRGDAENPAGESWGGAFVRPDSARPYWTDIPDPTLREGNFPGAKTVNRWRENYLRDWQQRMAWLRTLPIRNAGFEQPGLEGWGWWSRAGEGSAELSAEARSGNRAVRLRHDGELDWAFSNSTRHPNHHTQLAMKPHLLPSIALLALASMAGHTQPAAATRDPLYAVWLQTETAAFPGEPQLAIDGADLAAFSRPASGHARSEIVEVAGQPFGQAIRVHVRQPVQPVYQVQLTTPNTRLSVSKGDTLLIVYHARCLESKTESGGGSARGYLQLNRPPWTGTGALEANPGRDWQKRYARFTATQDYPAGSLHLTFHLGQAAQVLEFGGLALLNFGPQVDLAKLPVSRITYAGREADAPWREAAAERIERHRKGNLRIEVVDAHGQPLAGATVRAKMTRHAYQFGTFLERPALAQTPDGERYRETVKRLFNRVTCPWYWADWGWPRQEKDYLALSQWARDNQLHRRSHTLIWPDWRWTPSALRQLEGDPAALRQAVHDSIAARVRLCRPFEFDDYDVVNELRDNHRIVDLLGQPILVEWFKLVKALDPKAKPGINEYAIIAGGGHTEKEQAIYEGQIQYLLDHGAPLGVIGFQCHFGEDLTPPAQVVKILDRFARFGLPLHATEFDISTNDEEAQGDYLRDFLTAFFSHPATEAITQWGFWEGQHWIPRAALFRKDWSVKPNGQAYLDLVLKDWWTDVSGKTDAQGVFATRGFLGHYDVLISGPASKKTVSVELARPGTSAKVVY